MVMWVGASEFDLLLGNVHSLKEKRSNGPPADRRGAPAGSRPAPPRSTIWTCTAAPGWAWLPSVPTGRTWSTCWTPWSGWSRTAPRSMLLPVAAPSAIGRLI